MNTEQIEKFLSRQKSNKEQEVKIGFKNRNTLYGLFVEGKDYNDLKSKNFWRIVTEPNLAEWNISKDINLAKIFSGAAFTKLAFKEA